MTLLFLSRLKLNPRDRHVRRDLADCHDLHRTLLTAFPQAEGETARAQFGVLFRLDAGRDGSAVLLVQSKLEPDWARLPEGYLLERAACKTVADLYDGLQTGQRLIFRLRANPTKRLPLLKESRVGKERGKRVELQREEDQLAWLRRKSTEHGFRLLSAHVNPDIANLRASPEQKTFGRRAGERLTFGAVLFEGELEITDATRFRQTLADGIGAGKAYGFGLLSIALVRAHS
ncbi:MAG: type I-E CRISPR-associated protein Cas6/Cse3/CasE [Blastocatellia bacterium]